jgi:hypothetical protein
MFLKRFAMLTTLLLGLSGVSACQSTRLPMGSADQRQKLAQLAYPGDAPVALSADIVVQREGAAIRLVNRTVGVTSPGVLWLNEQYAGYVGRLAIGPDNVLPLHGFVNRHGETFPTGSFLAPDKAERVYSAELVQDGQDAKMPLTVWPDERWFD